MLAVIYNDIYGFKVSHFGSHNLYSIHIAPIRFTLPRFNLRCFALIQSAIIQHSHPPPLKPGSRRYEKLQVMVTYRTVDRGVAGADSWLMPNVNCNKDYSWTLI